MTYSQAWDGECLGYDRRTGDLFALPELAVMVLGALGSTGPQSSECLARMIPMVETSELQTVIEGLLANGLVERLSVDCCGNSA